MPITILYTFEYYIYMLQYFFQENRNSSLRSVPRAGYFLFSTGNPGFFFRPENSRSELKR